MTTRRARVRVLDSGKVGGEHFEFNRGVIEALRGAGVDVRFHGYRSMIAAHATVISGASPGGAVVSARAHSFFGIEDRTASRWARAATKIGSLWPTLNALLGADRLVVAYSTPISHVLLALASRWRRAPTIAFLHAEVEFLNTSHGPRLFGEKLMTLALRMASPRLRYLMLTDEGVRVLRERGGTSARIDFCPHPMSAHMFERVPADGETIPRAGAFAMIKKAEDVLAVQALLRALPAADIGGCRFNGEGLIGAAGGDPAAVLASKRFLSRESLETRLHAARWFLFPPGREEYASTASGLACSAAAAGARVIGQENGFMRSYAAQYPQAFSVAGSPDAERPGQAVDNLVQIAVALLAPRA